jgi:hypothetical protein
VIARADAQSSFRSALRGPISYQKIDAKVETMLIPLNASFGSAIDKTREISVITDPARADNSTGNKSGRTRHVFSTLRHSISACFMPWSRLSRSIHKQTMIGFTW